MASRRPPGPVRTTPSVTTPAPTTASAPESPTSPAKAPTAAAPKPRASRAKKDAAPKAASAALEISEDVRRGMIAEAAYLRAERRGFSGDRDQEREDWISAEAEVDALLKAGHGSSRQ